MAQARLREALTAGGPTSKDRGPPVADGNLTVTPDTPEVLEWRSRRSVIDSIASCSDYLKDEKGAPRPSDLYARFTWKIDKFSQISKRELRSEVFEVGNYKWYILVYPEGCDVANHLSLFLCVADHDKLLPGWSHFAQFTIAIVNREPKASKYSDTLHRFCKKEHDWGWKKFMELGKLDDGFVVRDTLVIKAQVQVLRDTPSRPFLCLDPQYRRELVRVYLSNVEGIARRFAEERRVWLSALLAGRGEGSFREFWARQQPRERASLSREAAAPLLRGLVKWFFNEKEVTSSLVMDSLVAACRSLEADGRACLEGRSAATLAMVTDTGRAPAPSVLLDGDRGVFFFAGDVVEILDLMAADVTPAGRAAAEAERDDLSRRTSEEGEEEDEEDEDEEDQVEDDGQGHEEPARGQEDAAPAAGEPQQGPGGAGPPPSEGSGVDREERRLAALGRLILEYYVAAEITREQLEAAWIEAESTKRAEALILEEEAAGRQERERAAARTEAERERRVRKKEKERTRRKTRDERAKTAAGAVRPQEKPVPADGMRAVPEGEEVQKEAQAVAEAEEELAVTAAPVVEAPVADTPITEPAPAAESPITEPALEASSPRAAPMPESSNSRPATPPRAIRPPSDSAEDTSIGPPSETSARGVPDSASEEDRAPSSEDRTLARVQRARPAKEERGEGRCDPDTPPSAKPVNPAAHADAAAKRALVEKDAEIAALKARVAELESALATARTQAAAARAPAQSPAVTRAHRRSLSKDSGLDSAGTHQGATHRPAHVAGGQPAHFGSNGGAVRAQQSGSGSSPTAPAGQFGWRAAAGGGRRQGAPSPGTRGPGPKKTGPLSPGRAYSATAARAANGLARQQPQQPDFGRAGDPASLLAAAGDPAPGLGAARLGGLSRAGSLGVLGTGRHTAPGIASPPPASRRGFASPIALAPDAYSAGRHGADGVQGRPVPDSVSETVGNPGAMESPGLDDFAHIGLINDLLE